MMTQPSFEILERFADHNWNLIRCNAKVRLTTEIVRYTTHNELWVVGLYTHSSIRGNGFAREAMERLCQTADEESIELNLRVMSAGPVSNSRLIQFYESLGFELVDTRELRMTRQSNPEEI